MLDLYVHPNAPPLVPSGVYHFVKSCATLQTVVPDFREKCIGGSNANRPADA